MRSKQLIIDIQGFRDNDGSFILKEVAIVRDDRVVYHAVIRCEPRKTLNANRQREANYNSSFVHGISWYDGTTNLKRAIHLMKVFASTACQIWVKGPEKCKVLEKILHRKMCDLEIIDCPKASELPKDDTFEECTLPVHRQISDKTTPYKCAKLQVQQYARWFARPIEILEPGYCCTLNCFQKSDTEVDELACEKCESYGQCYCRCTIYMRDKLAYLLKQANIVREVLFSK